MMLDRIQRGERVRIISIADPLVRHQAIRFGIEEGQEVVCAQVIPGGPVILHKNMQEIAVGRRLAGRIAVERVSSLSWLRRRNPDALP